MVDPVLTEVVQDGLAEVERNLHEVVQSEFHPVTETSLHLVEAGGKRIRPLFTLLASQFGADWDRDKVIKAATVVELTHLATLYHDDVMDEATMRRGAVSANVKWDNSIAILTGDFLFAHASRLTADLGTDAARIIAETFSVLVTGQMRETVGPQPGEDPISHYLKVIEEKTGVLIATAARFGGMFSDATDEQIDALRRYADVIGAYAALWQGHVSQASIAPSSDADLDALEARLGCRLPAPLGDDASGEALLTHRFGEPLVRKWLY